MPVAPPRFRPFRGLAGAFAVARTSTVSTASAGGRATAQSQGGSGVGAGAGAVDTAVRAALAPWEQVSRRAVQSAGARPAAVTTAPPEACADGGTRTATFDDRDGNSTTSAGDVVTVVFAGCAFDQVVLDGTMVVTVASVTGDTDLSGTMQFQDVKVTAGSAVTTITGSADVTETDDGSQTDDTIVVGSNGLKLALASPAYTDSIGLVHGFTIATTTSDDGDAAMIRLDGSFAPASLLTPVGNLLTVATVQPLVLGGGAYASAGQLRVIDNVGGNLVITAIDGASVDLRLNVKSDDTSEDDVVVAWSTLLPS